MRERLRWTAAVVAMVSLMARCTKEVSVDVTTESVPEPPTVITETESEIFIRSETEPVADDSPHDYYLSEEWVERGDMICSYLMGEMMPASQGVRRPAAVMMSNDKETGPQYGTNRAGVVHEAPVGSTMNRYTSLIEDYDDPERIGSMCGCHTYYIYFAREFDAVYIHYRQSTFVKSYLSSVDNINSLEVIGGTTFYRSRDKKQPHNVYISGEHIQASIWKLSYIQDYGPSYQGYYRFARDGKGVSLEERPGVMDAVTIKSGYVTNRVYFAYEPSDGLYRRYQYGGAHQGGEGSIMAKNVIFQYYQSGYCATAGYLSINVHISDCRYFMIESRAIPINQEKNGEFGVIHYYDQEHDEIVLNQGQTWICIISTRGSTKSEITGNEGA